MTVDRQQAGGTATAALIVTLNYSNVALDELNDWYDTEHIPQRLALPGFVRAERWMTGGDQPVSIVLYEIESLGVLTGEHYRGVTGANLSPWSKRILPKCHRDRFEADLTLHRARPGVESAEGLLLVGMNVEPDAEEEFDRWYTEEHVPSLYEVPGVLSARRYRAAAGAQKHLAMYHLTHPDVQASPAWATAINTPWASRVRPRTRDRVRFVGKRYHRASQ